MYRYFHHPDKARSAQPADEVPASLAYWSTTMQGRACAAGASWNAITEGLSEPLQRPFSLSNYSLDMRTMAVPM